MQGVRNMLANESLFLPTVDLTIDLLPVAHKVDYALKMSGPVPMFPIFQQIRS
jgi:hypothetical protein